jgi:hypothetical protein
MENLRRRMAIASLGLLVLAVAAAVIVFTIRDDDEPRETRASEILAGPDTFVDATVELVGDVQRIEAPMLFVTDRGAGEGADALRVVTQPGVQAEPVDQGDSVRVTGVVQRREDGEPVLTASRVDPA